MHKSENTQTCKQWSDGILSSSNDADALWEPSKGEDTCHICIKHPQEKGVNTCINPRLAKGPTHEHGLVANDRADMISFFFRARTFLDCFVHSLWESTPYFRLGCHDSMYYHMMELTGEGNLAGGVLGPASIRWTGGKGWQQDTVYIKTCARNLPAETRQDQKEQS